MDEQATKRLVMAVDPGVSGAVAIKRPGSPVSVFPYTTEKDAAIAVTRAVFESQTFHAPDLVEAVAYLESVHASPGAGPKQSFTFGENFGVWKGIFATRAIEVRFVKPQEWQRLIPGLKGTEGTKRKNLLKQEAQRRFPDIKVTLKNADALLILDYALNR